jgi:hypothetical protein
MISIAVLRRIVRNFYLINKQRLDTESYPCENVWVRYALSEEDFKKIGIQYV